MGIGQVIDAYVPLLSARSTAEIDDEISEELQFHLEMRTRDNLLLARPLLCSTTTARRKTSVV